MLHRSSLTSLGDEALLQSLKAVAARSNQITAVLLAHLAEVEARGAHRLWACPTLQAYCVYELRLSEDEAQRRCRAARFARRFPRLLDMLADSSLHLTGLLLVGPHLTLENESELLARVAFRTKREIERILAEVAPRPDVPSLVQPLGPARDGSVRRAPGTWAAFVRGFAGLERDLPRGVGPGQAPALPVGESDELALAIQAGAVSAAETAGADEGASATGPTRAKEDQPTSATATEGGAAMALGATNAAPPPETPAKRAGNGTHLEGTKPAVSSSHPLRSRELPANAAAALRYRIQFTADQAFVDLLSEARDLLWHQLPDGDLFGVQRLALEALVTQLRRRKYGATRRHAPEGVASSEQRAKGAPATESLGTAAPAPSAAAGPSAAPAAERDESTAPALSDALPRPASSAGPGSPALARESDAIARATPPRGVSALARSGAPTPPASPARPAAMAPARSSEQRAMGTPAQESVVAVAPTASAAVRPSVAPGAEREESSAPERSGAPTRPASPAGADPTALARSSAPLPLDARAVVSHTSSAPARSGVVSVHERVKPAAPPARVATQSPRSRAGARAHLPAALRREVWQRDAGRCTFVDARGVRCLSTAALEFHHQHAHALGGPSTRSNLTLRCRAHNRLAAERDFGAETVAARIAERASQGS